MSRSHNVGNFASLCFVALIYIELQILFSDEDEDTKPGYFGVASFDHRVQEMIFSR